MITFVEYDRIIRNVIPQALVPVSGKWIRYMSRPFANTTRPWRFSAKHSSRFYDEQRQPRLYHLYLAEDDHVARLESRSVFRSEAKYIDNPLKNSIPIEYDVNLKHVFDLPSIMPALFTAQEQTGDWAGYKDRSQSGSLVGAECKIPSNNSDPICPTQRFGKAISLIHLEKKMPIDGLLYISAQFPVRRCLMIFINDADADDHGIPGRLIRQNTAHSADDA